MSIQPPEIGVCAAVDTKSSSPGAMTCTWESLCPRSHTNTQPVVGPLIASHVLRKHRDDTARDLAASDLDLSILSLAV